MIPMDAPSIIARCPAVLKQPITQSSISIVREMCLSTGIALHIISPMGTRPNITTNAVISRRPASKVFALNARKAADAM